MPVPQADPAAYVAAQFSGRIAQGKLPLPSMLLGDKALAHFEIALPMGIGAFVQPIQKPVKRVGSKRPVFLLTGRVHLLLIHRIRAENRPKHSLI